MFRLVILLSTMMLGNNAFSGQQCVDCHIQQNNDWLQSDHEKSMALPTSESVVANFDDQLATHYGQKAKF